MKGSPAAHPVVWVVDDSPLDAERARRVLEATYRVETFADGAAMLEHLAANPAPDVLVLDRVMPGISGLEVCRFLRCGDSARQELAILLLTMQTQTSDIVEGLAAGANDYLAKPFADPELRARVDALVRSNRLLERALAAEAHVRQLLENAPDPLLSLDDAGLVTFANSEAQRVLARTFEEMKDRPLTDVLPGVSLERFRERGKVLAPLPDIQIGDQIYSPTVRSHPDAAAAGVTIALRDVTARRDKESRRLDFYSIIAHDLRSPLGAMLMRTELMLRGHRGILSAEMIADLRKMDANMRRLVALINDFLDFARMEDAAHKMKTAPVDAAELINDVIDEFRPLIESTGQKILLDLPVSPVVALGDRSRLQQALTNLVANAIKFAPAGGVIGLRARQIDTWCEIDVEDDGPGIPEDIMPTLFKRYSRAPGTARAAGTGLGLLIVREIVEAHGGAVGVESTFGRGSRFWFRIPAADVYIAKQGERSADPPRV